VIKTLKWWNIALSASVVPIASHDSSSPIPSTEASCVAVIIKPSSGPKLLEAVFSSLVMSVVWK
jgi:hypothetical protein